MKKLIFLSFSILISFYAFGFELKKVSGFAQSEKFINSQSGIIYHKNNIYVLSYSGLLIYALNEEGVPELSKKIKLNGIPATMTINDSVLFVALQGGFDKLYKIDIADANNAYISDSIMTKGSYLHCISGGFLYVNELSYENTWQLAKYDFSFRLIERLQIPHKYWALQKARKQTFFIHSKDTLFLYSLNEGLLHMECAAFIDEKIFINKIEIQNDTLLFLSSNANMQIYNIASLMEWRLVASLGVADDFKNSGDKIFIKSNNKIGIYDISDVKNPKSLELLIIESYITSFSLNSEHLWVSTFGNELITYKKGTNGYALINNHPGQRRIIASVLINDRLLIETDNNKLFYWDIKDVENPQIDSVAETTGRCLKLLYQDSILQRVYYDPLEKIVKQSISKLGTNSQFNEITANSLYRGDLHSMNCNSDTSASFYNGHLFSYIYVKNKISIIDSVKVCEDAYGEIVIKDSNIFLATRNKLFCLKYKGNNKPIEIISKFDTFIPLPDIANYDSLIIISDRSCHDGCKIIDCSNMYFPFISKTVDEAGPILLAQKTGVLFLGCKNTSMFFMNGPKENNPNGFSLFQDYSNRLNNHIYELVDKKYLVTVKETGATINSFK